MDISALSADNFNAVEWINAHYKKYVEENDHKVGDTLQKASNKSDDSEMALNFINSYVSKLQLYVQQVNYAVEDTSQQVVANMPRIIKDARALHAEVEQLQRRMLAMRKEVSTVQEETGDCMAALERLNNLQTKLQTAKESLMESDGWGKSINQLEDAFERNDLKSVCEKLVALQKSLQAQEQLPGHDERKLQVEDFKNRLEALASSSVVQCFAEANLEQAQRYVAIFAGIQRTMQLQQYYRAVQKNSLQQKWKETLELQATEFSTQQQQFLTLFYDVLLEFCQRQTKWCSQVFESIEDDDDNEDTIGQLQPLYVLAELLPSLQPTRDAHILQLMKSSNERLELLQLYAQANHTFVLHLNAFLENSGIQLTPELSQRVGESIYEYFYKFIQQYPRLEETQLSTQIDRLYVTQNSAADAVRHLDDSNRKIFEWLREACERCSLITDDLALCKLIILMGAIFKRVLENFTKTQRQLSLNSGGAGTENWSMLQYTMSLLQCLSDFQIKLNKFEKSLHERMTILVDKLKTSTITTTPTNSVVFPLKTKINIYRTYDRMEQKRLLTTIADYQQKCQELTNSQMLSLGIFTQIYDALKSHFIETHDITLNILLQPIEAQLVNIQPPVVSSLNSPVTLVEMPAFSFAPQEFITQIGQYLLTLPQHLEPLLLSPSSLLKQALETCNIKYTQSIPCADILLSLVVEQSCVLFQTQILQIKTLNASAAKQLAVDIEYLSSVVEELGLTLSLHLTQILTLLKASPENYLNLSSGCEPRLVTAIRQMRNILSTQ